MEATTEVLKTKSLIEQIAEIQGPAANAYKVELQGAPHEVAAKFIWSTHLLESEKYRAQLKNFLDRNPGFSVNQEEIISCWEQSFTHADEIYKILFPGEAPQLAYHNLIHAKVTAMTANKMILGALIQPEYQNIDHDRLLSLIKLSAIASVFHEINDWWCLGNNPNLGEAKTKLEEFLTQQGLSTVDFNRLIAMDKFKKDVGDLVDVVLDPSLMNDEDKFLPDNQIPSITDKSFLTLFGNILASADFSQMLNPGYHQPAKVTVDDKSCTSSAASVALAVEAAVVRPNALLKIGFGNADGIIFWDKVKLNSEFVQYAISKIMGGLPHLKAFDSKEYERASSTLKTIRTYFGLTN